MKKLNIFVLFSLIPKSKPFTSGTILFACIYDALPRILMPSELHCRLELDCETDQLYHRGNCKRQIEAQRIEVHHCMSNTVGCQILQNDNFGFTVLTLYKCFFLVQTAKNSHGNNYERSLETKFKKKINSVCLAYNL